MKSLLQFEAYYFSRQPAFLIAIVLSIAIGYLLSGRVVTTGNVQLFSAHNLTYFLAMLSLPALFIVTLLSASTLIRDNRNRFIELVNATPVSQPKLKLSRFFGLVVASLLVCFLTCLLYVLPALMLPMNEPVFGTFSLLNAIWPVLVILIPNVIVICSILFFFSQFLTKTIWIYLIGLGIYILYMSVTAYFDAPMFTASKPIQETQLALASILDPFAISAFIEQTQFWSSIEKNAQRVSLEGNLLVNRIFWIAISCILVLQTIKKGSSSAQPKGLSFKKKLKTKAKPQRQSAPVKFKFQTTDKIYSSWSMFTRSFFVEASSIFASVPFALLLLFTAVLVTGQIIASVEMNSVIGAQHPYTSLLAPIIVMSLKIVSVITVGFYAAELAYRAKEAHFHEVLMATPVSRWSLYLSQLLVLCFLILSLLFVAILSAVSYQVANGFYAIDWGLYVSLIPVYAVPMMFLAVLCMCVQFAVNNKNVGIILSVMMMLLFGTSAGANIGLEHVLVKFSSLATVRYSDFNGFDYFWTNIITMLFHWGCYSIALVFVGYALFNRVQGDSNIKAIVSLPKKLSSLHNRVMFTSLGIALCSTVYVYWNTNELNTYQTFEEQKQHRFNYETQFAQYRDKNAPFITEIKTEIEFYPNDYALHINGEFQLENSKRTDITEFIVTMPNQDIIADINITKASVVEHIREFNTFKVKLSAPLKFKEKLTLRFTSQISRVGFKHQDLNLTLVSNGSYFHSEALFPYIGFNSARGVIDEKERARLGLPAMNNREPLTASRSYQDHLKVKDANLVEFEAIVSTSADQTAIAPGDLIKQWTENDRQYFHYKVNKPTSNFFGFSSARYEKLESTQNGKLISIYYHPEHNKNIAQMMKTARLSMARFSAHYSPYPFAKLTFVEIPYQGFARAYPGTIFFGENAGFKENLSDETNLDDFSSVVAHEVAHQWWGHQLKTANTQGATLLIESLAEYSSLTIMRELYGEDYVKAELKRATARYLGQRGQAEIKESALYVMNDERYLRYEKGLVALHSIAQKVGQESFNELLRELLADNAFAENNFITNLDFLSKFTGHKYETFILNWLTKVMLFDLVLSDVTVVPEDQGNYLLKFSVSMDETDHTEKEQGVTSPSNHEVDYLIYTDNMKAGSLPVNGRVTLENGEAVVSIPLTNKPAQIVLDPYLFFTDRNLLNNTKILASH